MIDTNNLLKKTMTKKKLKETMKAKRSQVAIHQNLGTRDMKSEKYYDRNNHKKNTDKEVKSQVSDLV